MTLGQDFSLDNNDKSSLSCVFIDTVILHLFGKYCLVQGGMAGILFWRERWLSLQSSIIPSDR